MPERLIDANAAADKIMHEVEVHADEIGVGGVALMIGFARALRDKTDFPTIEAEPVRQGEWSEIYCYNEHGVEMADYECTNCGGGITKQRGDTPKYCEHCGAVMREEGAYNG